MAFVIKNPEISHVKKSIVADKVNVDAVNQNVHTDSVSVNQSAYNFVDEDMPVAGEDNISISDDTNELQLVDGKLIYRGEVYLSEELLQKHVQDEVNARKAELETVREENIQLGREEGYNEGIKLASEEYQKTIRDILNLMEKTSLMYEDLVGKSEDLLKETVYMAICKTFGRLLECENERVNVIQNVIAEIKNANLLKIKVSQADYQIIFKDENSELAANYNIEIDNRVEIGGCIVETDKGTFDGRLEVQLAKLREAIQA